MSEPMSETLDTKAQLCASLAAALVVYFENVPDDWEDHTLVLAKALARLTQEISGDIACGSFHPEKEAE